MRRLKQHWPLVLCLAALGATAATVITQLWRYDRVFRELGPTIFALALGLAALLIALPYGRPSMRTVFWRVVACSCGGGLLLGLATLGFEMVPAMALSLKVALACAPIAIALVRAHEAAEVREGSMLAGVRRATFALVVLFIVAAAPWAMASDPRLALVLLGCVAVPALMLYLQLAIMARDVAIVDAAFANHPQCNVDRGLVKAFYDLGVGDELRVADASPTYRAISRAAACRGDGGRARARLHRLSRGAALVALLAVAQAAALLIG